MNLHGMELFKVDIIFKVIKINRPPLERYFQEKSPCIFMSIKMRPPVGVTPGIDSNVK